MAGGGDVAVDVEGVGLMVEVEVEVLLVELKPSRRWLSASFFFSCCLLAFLATVPKMSSYLLFILCHECGVTLWASTRRQSLFPVTGEQCLLALTKAKRALSSIGVYFFWEGMAKEKAPSVVDKTKRTYRHYSMGSSPALTMRTSLNPIHNLCPQL